MVIELCLFTHYLVYPPETRAGFIRLVTEELRPYRNLYFEIWNEYAELTVEHYHLIKELDPARLVTNSPGGAGVLGSDTENAALDFLSPHTSRKGNFWEVAPAEIKRLLVTYRKPVVDDEPARCGTSKFGGPKGATSPNDHIEQIRQVRQLGGYVIYHHDMFQVPYGDPSIPPHGIPDPEFSKFHLKAFEYLRSIAPPEVVR
jgi:hypothetical protein